MRPPRRNISTERKAAYYIGNGISIVGFLLFLSIFFSFVCMAADFGSNLNKPGGFFDSPHSQMSRSVKTGATSIGLSTVGFIMIIVGQVIANIGKRGLAGSGVILDPEQAREDVEPWSRMSGGMTNDMLSEVEPVQKIADGLSRSHDAGEFTEVVKVRCPNCRTLNDKDAKFCDQCGQAM